VRRVAFAAVVACVLLAGCGGGEDPAAVETTPTSPPATTDAPAMTEAHTATSTSSGSVVLRIYFLQDDKLVATSRRVLGTPAVGRAALDQLAAGPSETERRLGFRSACDADELSRARLTISNGEATVDPPLDGACAEQIGWTLLQFRTVSRVNGAARADLEDRAPAILVDTPAPYDVVTSPLRVAGTANTFESTFEYELLDADGRRLAQHFVTATSGTGTRGSFDFTVPFDVDRATDGELVVYESSAEDGSRINVRRIPLLLAPS